MSLAIMAKLKHLAEQVQALQESNDSLSERVLALEAEQDEPGVELDIDTLLPKRGPGRPRKVAQ